MPFSDPWTARLLHCIPIRAERRLRQSRAVVAGFLTTSAVQHSQRASSDGAAGFDLLFRWFVGLNIDEPVWDRTTFNQNRERLLNESVLREFFDRIVLVAEWRRLSSHKHLSVDGTLIDAWASHKSFKPKGPSDGKSDGDFEGESRPNKTHASTTDPDSRL